MNTIPISAVITPLNRIRETFDEASLDDLAADILLLGLIHLPILREGNILVSGERRLRAIQKLYEKDLVIRYCGQFVPMGEFPYTPWESLDEQTAKEIELSENIQREEIPWQTVVKTTTLLHRYRQSQDPNWGITDTAKELKRQDAGRVVTERLVLNDNLSRPEVRNAKSETEAKKILRKSMERELVDAQRKRVKKKKTKHTLIKGIAEEILKGFDSESIDVILSDPPYGKNADKFGVNVSWNTEVHRYKDEWEEAGKHYAMLADLGFQLAKPQAHLYAFCDFHRFPTLVDYFENYGWSVWPRPIIWYKHTGNLPKPDLGPRYVYECILFANKGNCPTTGLFPDIIDCPSDLAKTHAAQKPVEVYLNLLRRSALPGNTILDPFCGSGPVFPAAHHLGCTATGIDQDESSIALSQERINGLI